MMYRITIKVFLFSDKLQNKTHSSGVLPVWENAAQRLQDNQHTLDLAGGLILGGATWF
jgi:hypothetical protein